MAEQEKRTFKWGDKEYLLDDLLKMHADQENNYYRFARDKGQYDDTALSGLRQAISDRINAVKSGKAFDADGVLDTDIADNTTIQTQKKGLFRKAKYVDQDNTEWAKYYLNKLVGQLKPYEKGTTADKGAWDITKHGLSAYLTGQGLNAKDVFEKYDLRDKDNPEAARAFTQRRDLLKSHLTGYRNWLSGKGFDFTKNDNEWDDNFGADLDNLIANYDNLDSNALSAALRKIGAGEGYTTAFTSDKWDLSKSNAQSEAEVEKIKQEKQNKAWAKEKERRLSVFNKLNRRSGQMNQYIGKDKNFDVSDDDLSHYLESVKISGENAEKTHWDKLDAAYTANPYNASVAQIILPMKARKGRLGTIQQGNYNGWMYDPDTKNESRQSVMAFDPTSGKQEEIFIGHISDDWNRIKNRWMIDNGYINEAALFNKEGGVLELQTGGAFSSYEMTKEFKEKKNKERAKETGNTEKVQAARDRVVSNGDDSFISDGPTLAQPDAGFSGAEIARLVSIGADITSMFLDPVTGTAVGLGSTLTNFGADIADDGFQWEDVKNLGINAGFDLLGAIPLFGDALGTGTKITRNLIKWAPKVMTGLAAFQGVANFDGMMNSWSKFASGDKDQKLTVQDWRNIAQSIGLVTGATRAIKNKAAQSKMKKDAKVEGVVGVNVRDRNTGDIQQILVDGKTAEAIRGHKGDAKKIQETLSQLEGYKDKFGENGTLDIVTKGGRWQMPVGRQTKADGSKEWSWEGFRKEGRASVSYVYDFSKVPQGYGASVGYKIPGVSDTLNKWHQQAVTKLSGTPSTIDAKGAKTTAEVDAEVKALRDPVDAQIKAMQDAMARRTSAKQRINAQLTPAKTRLQDIQTRLRGVPDETTLNANKTILEQNIATNDANIATRQQLLDQAQKNLDKLLKKKRVPKKKQAQHKADIRRARASVQGHKTTLQGYEYTKNQYNSDMAKLKSQLQDYADIPSVQANVNRLQGIQSRLGRGNHTNAYNKLQQMLTDLQTNHSSVSGRQVNWDMSEILRQAGVQNAFKEGGSINRNKINKFLNYAKG